MLLVLLAAAERFGRVGLIVEVRRRLRVYAVMLARHVVGAWRRRMIITIVVNRIIAFLVWLASVRLLRLLIIFLVLRLFLIVL